MSFAYFSLSFDRFLLELLKKISLSFEQSVQKKNHDVMAHYLIVVVFICRDDEMLQAKRCVNQAFYSLAVAKASLQQIAVLLVTVSSSGDHFASELL